MKNKTALVAVLTFLAAFSLPAQIVNTWEEGSGGGVVTTVEQGAVSQDDYAAEGIINDWKDILKDFEDAGKDDVELDAEIRGIKATQLASDATNVFIGRDGLRYVLPTIPAPDGTDLFLLTPEGMTVYMAFDAPVYMQEVDDEILRWVRFYAHKRRDLTRRWFKRYREWEPRIKEYFQTQGVPVELAELCLIESGCTYSALSGAGALGMWQIMPDTGRSYGLTINTYRDDRLDPVLSTMAAAKILAANYRKTGEWTLAAAAYNCGPGRLNKGRPWNEVKAKLPKETQQYIPSLIAIHYIWTYRDRLGFEA